MTASCEVYARQEKVKPNLSTEYAGSNIVTRKT